MPQEPSADDDSTQARDAALLYAEASGWHVFPLRGKTPRFSRETVGAALADAGHDPELAGRWGSTSDPDLLAALWPGDATGLGVDLEASGLVCVDFDPPRDAEDPDAWTEGQRALLGLAGRGLEARTGRPGGLHLYFLAPASGAYPRTAHGLRPGVDLKASGGMCVLPPSVHPSGRRYAWAPDASPDDLEPLPTLDAARTVRAADVRRLLGRGRKVRADHRAAMLRVLDGAPPCGAKGEADYPEEGAHDFLRGLLWWLAEALPADADPESVGDLFEPSIVALQSRVVAAGGTPRESPELIAELFASAQEKLHEEAEARGLDVDPGTGRLRQPPARVWLASWRERRGVEYDPESRGASLDGRPTPTEQILRELRLDAREAGRTDGRDTLTDAYESWLFAERAEHRAAAIAAVAHDPQAPGDALRELAAVASGRPRGKPDADELAGWTHWVWATKRRMLGLPVERHLWLHLRGPQGSGKSTLVRRLLEPLAHLWLESKAVSTLQDPRHAFVLAENLVVFFDEMSKARGAEPEAIKAVVSGDHVDSRAMYTRIVERVPIRCGFISAANDALADLVRDETGNRRFFEVATPKRLDFDRVNSIDALAVWQSVDEHGPPPLAARLASFSARQAEDRYLGPVEAWVSESLEATDGEAEPETWVPTSVLWREARRWWDEAGYKGSSEQWKVPTLAAFGRQLAAALEQRSAQRRTGAGRGGRRERGFYCRWQPGCDPAERAPVARLHPRSRAA